MARDPIAEFLTSLKNGQLSGKEKIRIPLSIYKERLCGLLKARSLIAGFRRSKNGREIVVDLLYHELDEEKIPAIADLRLISRQSLRRFAKVSKLKNQRGSSRLVVLSTSRGLKTLDEALKEKVGGEILFEVQS